METLIFKLFVIEIYEADHDEFFEKIRKTL